MKKAIVALLLGMTALSTAHAGEYSGNPDRLPSVGLTFGGFAESGDVTLMSSGFSTKQNVALSNGHLILDGRIPVSDGLTLTGALGFTGSTTTADETPLLTGQKSSTSGVSFSLGLRIYIH